VIVQSIGGVGPDIFDCFNPSQLSAYVRSGIAWDVGDELAKRGIDIRRDCFSGILNTAIFDGKVYGIPTNIAADGIWFHRDLFRQYGIPLHSGPWKWSEFLPIAEKLTQRDRQGRPVRYGFYFDWWNFGHFFKGFGARLFNEDGTRCTVDSPQAIAAVQFMWDLVYKYKVSSTPVEEASMATSGGFGSGNISVFGSKHAAMALGGRWWLAQLRKFKDLDIGVMESPFENERRFHAYGRATLINKDSPRREQALQFLLYMAGPDYNRLVNAQADGICAFRQYANTPEFLFNPDYPHETDNATWRVITENAEGDETSPFVNGQVVNRVMNDQLDLVKSNQKSPAKAMQDAAAEINREMAKGLAGDPALAERYRKALEGEKQ
ncbi:MAG TPA: extracellular solute-binding protein, partial [Fimbriimonadaceae bacterium]|nr:extracellular solute-binding protein [Fimbriimonadaceae bacterium]